MSAVGKLIREPWDELGLSESKAFALQRSGATFGIWVFIASEVLFFGAIFLLYAAMRIEHADAFAAAARETNIVYGTLNTAILLTSGLTASVASRAAEHDGLRRLTLWCLAATAALGLAFLVVKGLEYREDIEKHLVPGPRFALAQAPAQLFFGFYWLSTGVHAIHLSIGIGLVGRLIGKGLRDHEWLVGNAQVEIALLYWGFVDVVWIFLYPALYLAGRAG
ncbi:Cytochrome c oxidase subunit 3 [Methylobacterium gnaphalii]|uniref:Cytochrome oxidase subunit III n=1 Tax=Methylobacterium gnaphalii TaxID=1010610 RepID=A0A512JGF4_9HYPH|nr:cytochrome oxidase subunit III [Methylobacterium gnaphalii]GJD68355.1 Cytochrome c oxidase subunit 3 [Methylobacterium gnaphalii]GLS48968.1 cytochrome oxidase subunit III [Methylobacterium gnaphalii]